MSEVITFTSWKGRRWQNNYHSERRSWTFTIREKSNFDRHGHRALQSRCCDGT